MFVFFITGKEEKRSSKQIERRTCENLNVAICDEVEIV